RIRTSASPAVSGTSSPWRGSAGSSRGRSCTSRSPSPSAARRKTGVSPRRPRPPPPPPVPPARRTSSSWHPAPPGRPAGVSGRQEVEDVPPWRSPTRERVPLAGSFAANRGGQHQGLGARLHRPRLVLGRRAGERPQVAGLAPQLLGDPPPLVLT